MKNFTKILVGSCFVFLSCYPAQVSADTIQQKHPLINQTVPPFVLPTISGEEIDLHQVIEGKRSLIYFWATWCANCKEKLIQFDQMKDQFADSGKELVVINLGEKKSLVERYLKRHGIGLDVVLDRDSTLSKPYGLVGLPTLLFVNENGSVVNIKHDLPH